jgi:AmiR/NasT family two-component response regulator
MVAHPRDHDGELLLRHFQRLGCRVASSWPPDDRLDRNIDLLLCLIEPTSRALLDTATAEAGPVVIGIIDGQNSSNLQLLHEITPHSVIIRPVQTEAIIATVAIARNAARHQRRQTQKIAKLEETLRAYRKVEQAKAILMERRQIGEAEAYSYLRQQAMRRRVPVGTVATVVVESNEFLSDERK